MRSERRRTVDVGIDSARRPGPNNSSAPRGRSRHRLVRHRSTACRTRLSHGMVLRVEAAGLDEPLGEAVPRRRRGIRGRGARGHEPFDGGEALGEVVDLVGDDDAQNPPERDRRRRGSRRPRSAPTRRPSPRSAPGTPRRAVRRSPVVAATASSTVASSGDGGAVTVSGSWSLVEGRQSASSSACQPWCALWRASINLTPGSATLGTQRAEDLEAARLQPPEAHRLGVPTRRARTPRAPAAWRQCDVAGSPQSTRTPVRSVQASLEVGLGRGVLGVGPVTSGQELRDPDPGEDHRGADELDRARGVPR